MSYSIDLTLGPFQYHWQRPRASNKGLQWFVFTPTSGIWIFSLRFLQNTPDSVQKTTAPRNVSLPALGAPHAGLRRCGSDGAVPRGGRVRGQQGLGAAAGRASERPGAGRSAVGRGPGRKLGNGAHLHSSGTVCAGAFCYRVFSGSHVQAGVSVVGVYGFLLYWHFIFRMVTLTPRMFVISELHVVFICFLVYPE